jgi:hypothetical protein
MKTTLHLLLLSAALTFGSVGGVLAQTETRSKSRLDIKPKAKTENLFQKNSFKPLTFRTFNNVSLDRSIALRSSTEAANRYFQNVLLSRIQKNNTPISALPENITQALPSVERREEQRGPADQEILFSNDKIEVSNIFPNPADDFAELQYSITGSIEEAKVRIYNLLGNEMKDLTLDPNNTRLRIQTREMPSGLYTYQLSVNGKSVVTKKMYVKH